jgi:hypothetical protein
MKEVRDLARQWDQEDKQAKAEARAAPKNNKKKKKSAQLE